MLEYIAKRIVLMIPVLIGVTLLIFTINYFTPGDPVYALLGTDITAEQYAAKQAELGLDKPFFSQFFSYIWGIATRFDFGVSYSDGRSVSTQLLERLPYTLRLGLGAICLAALIGVPCGILAATHHNSVLDRVVTTGSLIFSSFPDFWCGLLMMLLFAYRLGWLPATGAETWKHFILPTLALGLPPVAGIARMTRSSMLETIGQDFIRTARAKGIDEGVVIRRHALRNSIIPVLTVIGMMVGGTMAGAVVIETLFNIPGIGSLMRGAITARNFTIVRGGVILISIWICFINLLVDLLYAAVDPRIRVNYSTSLRKRRKKEISEGGNG